MFNKRKNKKGCKVSINIGCNCNISNSQIGNISDCDNDTSDINVKIPDNTRISNSVIGNNFIK